MIDLIIYFFIYSVLGVLLETVYTYICNGCYSVRRSMLCSPMCIVYGIGAAALIVSRVTKADNIFYIFIAGSLVCSAAEYALSLIYEKVCGVLLWDYSDKKHNINGRICVLYSLYWGIISILFCLYLHPTVKYIVLSINFKVKLFASVIMLIYFKRDLKLTFFEMKKTGQGKKSMCDNLLNYITPAPDRKIF